MLDWIWCCSRRIQSCMVAVPPASLVRAREDVLLSIPAPGAIAYVYGYHEEPNGEVTALIMDNEQTGWARPEWLEVVNTYEGVDTEFVRALTEVACAVPAAEPR